MALLGQPYCRGLRRNALFSVEPAEGAPICAAPGNVKPPAEAERSAVLAEKPVLE
jgi:hypothetical protein